MYIGTFLCWRNDLQFTDCVHDTSYIRKSMLMHTWKKLVRLITAEPISFRRHKRARLIKCFARRVFYQLHITLVCSANCNDNRGDNDMKGQFDIVAVSLCISLREQAEMQGDPKPVSRWRSSNFSFQNNPFTRSGVFCVGKLVWKQKPTRKNL